MNKLILFVLLLGLSPVVFSNDPLTVTDYAGRQVILQKPAKRIIALAPHIVENIFSAGAGDLLVGVVGYSDYPEAAKKIVRVGNIQGFSVETIVALKPDLVVVWPSGHSANIAQTLIDLGLTVYLDEPKKLEQVAKSIIDMGILTHREMHARRVANDYLDTLQQLKTHYSGRQSVTVLYQVWNDPLQTINGEHIISDVIRLCGGVNVYHSEPVIAPKISLESVIDRDPQAIVASGMGEERPEWLDQWQRWKALTAVKRQHLFFIPPDFIQRHTVRILKGAEGLCQQLDEVRIGSK